MEFFIYKNVQNEQNGQNGQNGITEKYYDPSTRYHYQNEMVIQKNKEPEQLSTPMLILVFVLYLALGIYAAKLSWFSNTKAGWSQGYKVLFALLAFMFPITYISAHILFKLDLLSRIKGGSMSYKF